MIPKKIHYCWLSDDEMPEQFKRYIDGWRRLMPDYEFILWDFNRFGRNTSQWVEEAFARKKYAFAADFIRCYALYHHGGIYLDSDVEVLKRFDSLLELPYFLGYENGTGGFEAAVIGAEKGAGMYADMLRHYECRSFVKANGELDTKPLPMVMRDVFLSKRTVVDINSVENFDRDDRVLNVFPDCWFSPINVIDRSRHITDQTFTIHHFSGSWLPWRERFKTKIKHIVGARLTRHYIALKKRLTH